MRCGHLTYDPWIWLKVTSLSSTASKRKGVKFFLKKNISEQNDEISNEILPSFRTEAVENRDVIFNQDQGS